MKLRYCIYSIECGYTPQDPYFETDNFELARQEADRFSDKQQATVYVVDRRPITMYEEVYIKIGPHFKEFMDLLCLRYKKKN